MLPFLSPGFLGQKVPELTAFHYHVIAGWGSKIRLVDLWCWMVNTKRASVRDDKYLQRQTNQTNHDFNKQIFRWVAHTSTIIKGWRTHRFTNGYVSISYMPCVDPWGKLPFIHVFLKLRLNIVCCVKWSIFIIFCSHWPGDHASSLDPSLV